MLLSTPLSLLSVKQQDLLDTFRNLTKNYNIQIHINEPLPEIQEPISLDIEHNERGTYVLCGIYVPSTNSYYGFTDLVSLRGILGRHLQFIAHNGVSDIESLRFWDCNVSYDQVVWDTMLCGHIIDSSLKVYGLKDMSKRELGIEYPEYDEIVGKHRGKTKKAPKCPQIESDCCERITLDKQPLELTVLYNAMDCFVTGKLYKKQYRIDSIREEDYFKNVEKPLAPIFDQMSIRGVRIDLEYLKGLKDILEGQQRPIKAAILNELGSINLNSPIQLLEALNAKGIKPILKGKGSTDKRALATWNYMPIVQNLLQYSELETLLSSFVYPYLERQTKYVHPFYNQVGTRTGRLSCSNPNLLQIPKKTENGKLLRRMFIPRDGFVMGDADYGQIEPRLMAHLSEDPALCEVFRSGVNFHEFTRERMGFSNDEAGYAKAKVLNLSVGYRATFKSVGQQLGVGDGEAQKEIDKWWALFPGLRRWQDRLIFESKRSGFFTTLLGRRIRVDDLSHGNAWRRESAERQLLNNIAQASAREVMALAMIKVSQIQALSNTFGLLVQVYDELLWESEWPETDKAVVISCMENAVKLKVPLIVECKTGPNWAEVY